MKTYKWVPEPLDGLCPDGTRWVLYQINHRKGYVHYIGRVCKHGSQYHSEVGKFDSMYDAARKLLQYGDKLP